MWLRYNLLSYSSSSLSRLIVTTKNRRVCKVNILKCLNIVRCVFFIVSSSVFLYRYMKCRNDIIQDWYFHRRWWHFIGRSLGAARRSSIKIRSDKSNRSFPCLHPSWFLISRDKSSKASRYDLVPVINSESRSLTVDNYTCPRIHLGFFE